MHMNRIKLLTSVCIKVVTSISSRTRDTPIELLQQTLPLGVASIRLSPQTWIHAISSQSFNLRKTLFPVELVVRRSLEESCQKNTSSSLFVKYSLQPGLFPQQTIDSPSWVFTLQTITNQGTMTPNPQ